MHLRQPQMDGMPQDHTMPPDARRTPNARRVGLYFHVLLYSGMLQNVWIIFAFLPERCVRLLWVSFPGYYSGNRNPVALAIQPQSSHQNGPGISIELCGDRNYLPLP